MKNRLIQILSLEKRQAKTHLFLPGAQFIGLDGGLTVENGDNSTAAPKSTQPLSAEDGPAFKSVDEIRPVEKDFIYPQFRAISQGIVPGYWLDFSTRGVLEAVVDKLKGQTVYKNHYYWDVERWLGSVSKSVWDAQGENSDGVPGINVQLKIDALMNPRIARGLLMQPPAIHSVSVTVAFEFDFSHPKLVEERRFWALLGQEVEGHIVRLIVTKILEFREISLVHQGADPLAKRMPDTTDDGWPVDDTEMSADGGNSTSLVDPGTPTVKEKQTVKLNDQRKQILGLAAVTGEDVPDEMVLTAVDGLAQRAAGAESILTAARTEATRLATLAEVGEGGNLPAPIASLINRATGQELAELTAMYEQKVAEKFPHTCQSCGKKNVVGRSSVEGSGEIEEQGLKQKKAPMPATSIF